MSKTFVMSGRTVDLTAPSGGVVSGTFYKIGGFIGVATNSAAVGDTFPLEVTGVHDYTAEGAGSGQAWADGDLIYWDDTAHRFTKTSSANTKAGLAVGAKLTTDVVGRLKLITVI